MGKSSLKQEDGLSELILKSHTHASERMVNPKVTQTQFELSILYTELSCVIAERKRIYPYASSI